MTMDSPRLIKKYANRRLYDTVESRHVTLADLRTMIVAGTDIKVIDDTSGEDITRALLLQIIVDREQAGQPLLTEVLLAQLIRFHGNPMQGMMADYLQRSVGTFLEQQHSVQSRFRSALATTPVDTLRELAETNAAAWGSLMKGFVPGEAAAPARDGSDPGARGADSSTGRDPATDPGAADARPVASPGTDRTTAEPAMAESPAKGSSSRKPAARRKPAAKSPPAGNRTAKDRAAGDRTAKDQAPKGRAAKPRRAAASDDGAAD